MTKNNTTTVSIDLIVQNNEGQVLLGEVNEKWQMEGKYLWGLPGREISFGETLDLCAKRNLHEELGMEMIYGEVVCVNSNFGFDNHYVVVGISVKAKGVPTIKKPEDWIEWKWFELSNIPSALFPSAKLTLDSIKKNIVSLELEQGFKEHTQS